MFYFFFILSLALVIWSFSRRGGFFKKLLYLGISCLAITLLYIVMEFLDKKIAAHADEVIAEHDAYFYERYDFEKLDWQGDKKQQCVFKHMYFLYPYQTCLVGSEDGESTGIYAGLGSTPTTKLAAGESYKAFFYTYTRVTPAVIFLQPFRYWGRSPNSAKFRDGLGIEIFMITTKADIYKIKRIKNGKFQEKIRVPIDFEVEKNDDQITKGKVRFHTL